MFILPRIQKTVRRQPFVAVKICKIACHTSHILPYIMTIFSGITLCYEYCRIRNHTKKINVKLVV